LQEGADNEIEDKKKNLRLVLLIKDFDDKLMTEAIKHISRLLFPPHFLCSKFVKFLFYLQRSEADATRGRQNCEAAQRLFRRR
jgi:hypothetical protein